MVRGQRTFAVAVIACVMAQVTLAQPAYESPTPTTRAGRVVDGRAIDRRDDDRRGEGQMQRPWRERLGSFDAASGGGELTEQEMAELRRFMETHSSNRLKRLEDVPEGRQKPIWDRIRGQYQALMRTKEEDPQIYDLRIKRLTIEDAMFDLGSQLRQDQNGKGKDFEQLRSKLREQLRLFVENTLEERRIRLDRVTQRVKDEQQKYERVMGEKAALIERGMTDIVENERGGTLRDLVGPIWPQLQRPRERNEAATTAPADDAVQ